MVIPVMTIQAFHTFQDGATATGNGTALRVRGAGGVVVDVIISDTATVVAEGKIGNSGTWRTLRLKALATGTTATSATASGHFAVDVRGMDEVRVRVSAFTAGTVTVTGRLLADGEAVGSDVVTATISGTVTVDTELPAAAALPADNSQAISGLSIPTVRAVMSAVDANGAINSSLVYVRSHPGDAGDPTSGSKLLLGMSFPELYNGATYDRQRANLDATGLSSALRTATTNTGTIVNYNHRGLVVFIYVTSGTTGGLTLKLYGYDPAVAANALLATATQITTTTAAMYTFQFYPGSPVGASAGFLYSASVALPRRFILEVAHADASNWTYGLGYSLIL